MTKEKIIEMAIQAGFSTDYNGNNLLHAKEIEVFAKMVAQKEREECANRASVALLGTLQTTTDRVLKAIRARGQDAKT